MVLKQLPSLLGVKYDDLTDENILWLRLQIAIDDGFGRCHSCRKVGMGPYCGECGEPFDEDAEMVCLHCKPRIVRVRGKFCTQCGNPSDDTLFVADLKAGRLSYAELNEQTRAPVDEQERALIETGFGYNHWDAAGNPVPQRTTDGR